MRRDIGKRGPGVGGWREKLPNYHGKPIEYFELRGLAKNLRTEQTKEEALLWRELKGSKFEGMKFRRQHVIKPYIVDFICLQERLVVELDGIQHQWDGHREADEVRDKYLNSLGLDILRFSNRLVNANLPHILSTIAAAKGRRQTRP